MKDSRVILLVVVAAVALIGGIIYLNYIAYMHRFPQVPWWTFLFQGGR